MTKVEIVQKIKSAAKEYKSKLLGKTFLYVYENGSLEVSFRKAEFAHLTGAGGKESFRGVIFQAGGKRKTHREADILHAEPSV